MRISLIGGGIAGDPDRGALTPGAAMLLRETAQGLVAFDASGQVEPGLAESWTFTADGLSAIFRIRDDARWPNGREVTAADAAASLNRARASASDNALKPLLTAIDQIVPMTDRVVEIDLKAPRPNLLQLLAQPELSIRRDGVGAGPWRIAARRGGVISLNLPQTEEQDAEAEPVTPPVTGVSVRGERAARAIVRFVDGSIDAVFGGTATDWPMLAFTKVGDGARRIDPAEGLFGIGLSSRSPLLADADVRKALSMAIDRDAIAGIMDVPRWTPMTQLLPGPLDSGAAPAQPGWADGTMDERRAAARSRILAWSKRHGAVPAIRLSLPEGPGMNLLYGRIAADWSAIGVRVRIVRSSASDAWLIDEVAPNASANWYLTRTGCDYDLACSSDGDHALKASRGAASLADRARLLAQADAAAAKAGGYIPIAKPLRWSLVTTQLNGFRTNSFAIHPFAELRQPAN